MIEEQKPDLTPDLTVVKRKGSLAPFVVLMIGLAAFALWRLMPNKPVARQPNAPVVPAITDVQTGTYSTTTNSIVVQKDMFNQTEDINFHGVVNNVPAGSQLMVLLRADSPTSSFKGFFRQLPNANPVVSAAFYFNYHEKRPPGSYTLLLELFGPDKQQIGQKVEKTITVK